MVLTTPSPVVRRRRQPFGASDGKPGRLNLPTFGYGAFPHADELS